MINKSEKYLVIQELEEKQLGLYKIKGFNTLKKAVGYVLTNNLLNQVILAKSIQDYEVIEITE